MIAEYKQIDVKIEENIIPILDEEGNDTGEFEVVTKEIPVFGLAYREETIKELVQKQIDTINRNSIVQPSTIEEKIRMLAEQIDEVFPEGTIQDRSVDGAVVLPFKVGYKWEKKLVGTTIIYESVPDVNAFGTMENPFYYTSEMPLIDNAFYMIDDKMYVWMGEWIEW